MNGHMIDFGGQYRPRPLKVAANSLGSVELENSSMGSRCVRRRRRARENQWRPGRRTESAVRLPVNALPGTASLLQSLRGMSVAADLMTPEVAAEAAGLTSRISSDRIASLKRIIAAGLSRGISIDDIRHGIARQHGVTLAGSRERAPIAWSDASERDFCTAFDSVRPTQSHRPRPLVLVTPPVEDGV